MIDAVSLVEYFRWKFFNNIIPFILNNIGMLIYLPDISIGTGIHDKDIITALNSLKLEADFYLNE